MNIVKKVVALKEFADNPAGAAGVAVGGAVAAAGHPYLAVAAAKGTEVAVKKGIEIAKDPAVQQKVKDAAADAVSTIKSRIGHLRDGIQESRK